MFTLGIYSREQYLRIDPKKRRFSGARVAYNLLSVGDRPSAEEVRAFEDICMTLQTSNGTFRTTFRNRFKDLDEVSIRWIEQLCSSVPVIRVQDRAVSSGLTSAEWAQSLFQHFPAVEFEASDLLVELQELSSGNGETWIVEPNGTPLQYIKPPFVVALHHPESWRNPILRVVAANARKRFAGISTTGCQTRRIPCVHPEAQLLARANPNFRFEVRSIFDRTPGACHVLRTMNILNLSYFSRDQLADAASAAFESLLPGGLWIVGRTLEEDLSNHATFFRRGNNGWEKLERLGDGSEIEELVLGSPATVA